MSYKGKDYIQKLGEDLYIEDHPFNQHPFNPEYIHSSGSEIYLRNDDFDGDIQWLERPDSRQGIKSATALTLFNKMKNRPKNVKVNAQVHKESRPFAPPRVKEEPLGNTAKPDKIDILKDNDLYLKTKDIPSDYTDYEYDATDVEKTTKKHKKETKKYSKNESSDQSDTDSSHKRKRIEKTKKHHKNYKSTSSDSSDSESDDDRQTKSRKHHKNDNSDSDSATDNSKKDYKYTSHGKDKRGKDNDDRRKKDRDDRSDKNNQNDKKKDKKKREKERKSHKDSNDDSSTDSDKDERKDKRKKSKARKYWPSSSSEDSSSSSDSREFNYREKSNKNTNLLKNLDLSEGQFLRLRKLLSAPDTSVDLNIKKILKLVPKNLVKGPCDHYRVSKEIKVLGKIPNTFSDQTNPMIFFSSFSYINDFKKPFTHATYNNLLAHYFTPESRNKMDQLEIDPNHLKGTDFVSSIITTIGCELLTSADYERKFHRYKFTTKDEDRPNVCVISLASWLKKTGQTTESQMSKLREKIAAWLIPSNLQSSFITATNVPNCELDDIVNWFSVNKTFYDQAIERKRKSKEKTENKAGISQVQGKKDNKTNPKPINQMPTNENKEKGKMEEKPKPDPNQGYRNRNIYPPCPHCAKETHKEEHCLKHPDPEKRKANREWVDKKRLEQAIRMQMKCLLCNQDNHAAVNCPSFPGVTPCQDPCAKCEKYGLYRRHHPVEQCNLPGKN
jgi:hypothetical protein